MTAAEGQKIYDAAVNEGTWSYTEGRKPGEPKKNFCANVGDCTDFVEASMRGAGMPELNPRPATEGYPGTSYRLVTSPQVGDVIVQAGHAGIYKGQNSRGQPTALQNGVHGTKVVPFGKGSSFSGTESYYRRLIPQ